MRSVVGLMAVFIGFSARDAQAGPWVRELGQAYVKGGYSRFDADTFVQPDGAVVEGTQYVGHTHHLYGEVGVAPKTQVVFNAPFVGSRNIIGDTAYINRWGGDLNAGFEVGDTFGKIPASFQVLGKFPLYDNADLNQYGDAAQRFPAIGDGQVDVTALLALGSGWSLGNVRGWFAGEVGYRHRTEWWLGDSNMPDREYLDGIPWMAQLGYSPRIGDRDMGWAFVSLNGINNFETDTVSQQFIQANAGVALMIAGGVAAELGYSQMIWTRTAAPGGGINFGLSYSK
ncbi:MAG: hypothetical protein AAFV53_20195 [Myxococcota bacterium]